MKKIKQIAGILLTLLTVGLFIGYAHSHPALFETIKTVGVGPIIGIIVLYGISLVIIGSILFYSVKWCGQTIQLKQNILLTGYSTLVNFFGPLQSGPGFRAVYLKAKQGVNLGKFIKISLVYYGCLAWFSAIFLFVGAGQWLALALVISAGVGGVASLWLPIKQLRQLRQFVLIDPKTMLKIASVTFGQVLILAVTYFVELHSIDHAVQFNQALSYTGTANFSLFVSLTPGAIGIREAFVLFTQHLSQLSSSTIIAASLLDRAVYFVFLGLIFLGTLSLHAKTFLDVRRAA